MGFVHLCNLLDLTDILNVEEKSFIRKVSGQQWECLLGGKKMKLKKEHLENKLTELLFLLPSLQGVKCVLGHFSVILPYCSHAPLKHQYRTSVYFLGLDCSNNTA